jgi:hypothetical protein
VNIADPPVRIALAGLALAVAVFLVIELHAETRLQAGRSAAFAAGGRPLAPARGRQVLDDLKAGERLHPGTDALLTEALVELRAGQAGVAEALARRAIGREPRNWEAWRALSAALEGRNAAGARRAAARARGLNPLAP